MITPDIRELLDTEAARINNPDFINDDPVQFPRRYSAEADIEIAALLSATIAWGNRKMICRDCDRLLTMMDSSPAAYTLDGAFEGLNPDANIHRTFFNRNLIHYLRGIRAILTRYGTLGAWADKMGIAAHEAPAWEFARLLSAAIAEANDGIADCRCIPGNIDKTALKRINMAFRWLVRRDGIVDIGIWKFLSPAQLYIPLDVHVGNVSRQLGLLSRRQDDRRAVDELTACLRTLRPDDPAIYDYALFGIGINSKPTSTKL
ncbi:MAG: TIGR02757 family protein [Muribaculaceae bacterium]|nr:TIGR02757 family protein [Muribaculaceae bacterium]